MLNSQREQPVWEQEPPREQSSPIEMIGSVGLMLRRQAVVIASMMLAGAALGSIYVMQTPPAFTAEASILVETRKIQLFNKSAMYDDTAFDGSAMETQLQILRSDKTILTVINKLHLTDYAEFVEPPESLVSKLRRLLARGFRPDGVDEVAKPAQNAAELTTRAMEAVQSRLDVGRIGSSYAIAIRFRSSDAARAAEVANTVADVYIDGQREARLEGSLGAAAWMQQRLKDLRQQGLAADQAVIDFKVKNRIVSAQGHLLNDQELGGLNAEVAAARERTAEALARLDRIQAVIKTNLADSTSGATVADALNNPVITKLRSESLELATRLSDWSARFGANHLAVVDLRRRLQNLRGAMLNEMKRVAETYKSDYEIAKQRQDIVEKQLGDSITNVQVTNQAQTTLRGLESAARTYSSLSDSFLQRYTEVMQQESVPFSDASVIARAPVPTTKSQPKTKLILAFATFAGALLGSGVGLMREMLDGVFRTAAQVERILQTDCIAVVPLMDTARRRIRRRERTSGGPPQSPRTIVRTADVIWNVLDAPHSRFAEAFRSLKLTLDSRGGRSNTVIGITSSLPNEGKSVTAAALALLMAKAGARVVLVDCDLRDPSLTRQLASGATCGLLDVVSGRSAVADAVWREPLTNLAFLPGRIGAAPVDSSEFFSMRATLAVFETLRSDYDYVVVDLPPVAPLVDIRATSGIIDAYAFVIEWGRTKVQVAEHALKSARVVQENLLGVVLSMVDLRGLKRYESNFRSLYANKDFTRYGYDGMNVRQPLTGAPRDAGPFLSAPTAEERCEKLFG